MQLVVALLQLSPKHNVFIIDAQDETSDRSYQIYRASRAVSDRVYYITNKAYDDDHVLTLLNPCADTVSLTYLQVFQLFAYRISKELRSIPKHPLFDEYSTHSEPHRPALRATRSIM